MGDEYFDITLDWDDTIFKKCEFYWFIVETDNTFWVECYFPEIKVSMTYSDYFTNFQDAFDYANGKWGSFFYNEDSNESETDG